MANSYNSQYDLGLSGAWGQPQSRGYQWAGTGSGGAARSQAQGDYNQYQQVDSGGGSKGMNPYAAIIGAVLQYVGLGIQMYNMGTAMRQEGRMMAFEGKDMPRLAIGKIRESKKFALARHDEAVEEVKSTAVAVAAGSGLTLESFAEPIADIARKGMLDRLAIQHRFNMAGYQQRQTIERTKAELEHKRRADKMQFLGKLFSSGGSITGSCCFIFIAGHGFLHPIVRKYRDEHMTKRNRRGYYWLSDRLVPLMKKSKAVRAIVKLVMIDPMTSYGKHYYGINQIGVVFAPVASFWLRLFTLLGFRKPYTRRGTQETV